MRAIRSLSRRVHSRSSARSMRLLDLVFFAWCKRMQNRAATDDNHQHHRSDPQFSIATFTRDGDIRRCRRRCPPIGDYVIPCDCLNGLVLNNRRTLLTFSPVFSLAYLSAGATLLIAQRTAQQRAAQAPHQRRHQTEAMRLHASTAEARSAVWRQRCVRIGRRRCGRLHRGGRHVHTDIGGGWEVVVGDRRSHDA